MIQCQICGINFKIISYGHVTKTHHITCEEYLKLSPSTKFSNGSKGHPCYHIKQKTDLVKRFWSKVNKNGLNGCWNWIGGVEGGGYGQIKVDGRLKKTHRFSWELLSGPIPNGVDVLHHCDNPRCVNPDHLFLGNDSDNIKDMYQKGRGPNNSGENNGRSKLITNQVYEIRKLLELGEKFNSLSARYGVTQTTIRGIGNKKLWKKLN